MTIAKLWSNWREFWFSEASPLPIALFRICFGFLVLQFCFLSAPDFVKFFGPHAIVAPGTTSSWMGYPELNILPLVPCNDTFPSWILILLVLCGLALVFGVFSRLSAFIVYLGLLSLDSRNHFVFSEAPIIMMVMALFLSMSSCGEILSLARLARVWKKGPPDLGDAKPASVFGQRLIQVHVAIIYWNAVCTKLNADTWFIGTAVYYASHLVELRRFSVPYIFDQLWVCRLLSWATLLVETMLFSLVWVREFRYPVLLLGVALQLGIDWAFALPMLSGIMISSYITFIEPDHLGLVMKRIRQLAVVLWPSKLRVVYAGNSDFSCRMAETVRRLDILHLIELIELSSSSVATSTLAVVLPDCSITGIKCLQLIVGRLPLLMPFAVLLRFPGVDMLVKQVGSKIQQHYPDRYSSVVTIG